jgi:hypothetical protein
MTSTTESTLNPYEAKLSRVNGLESKTLQVQQLKTASMKGVTSRHCRQIYSSDCLQAPNTSTTSMNSRPCLHCATR